MSSRKRRDAPDPNSQLPTRPPADFEDARSVQLLDAMADELAEALGEQLALDELAQDQNLGGA